MTIIPLTPVPDDLAERDTYDGAIIPLYSLFRQVAAKGETAITGKTFRNCRIDGPAVLLALGGVDFDRCYLGDPDGEAGNLLLKPMGTDKVTGAIPVAHCRFIECNFFSIGFTGVDGFLKDVEAAVKGQMQATGPTN